MPLCIANQPRLTCLSLGVALLISFSGVPATLCAQQPLSSSSAPSDSSSESAALTVPVPAEVAKPTPELPDAPSALLYPQTNSQAAPQTSAQTTQSSTSAPAPQETTNPDAVSPNGTQQTKRILGIMPNFRSVSADTKLPPMSPKDKFIIAGKDTFDYSSFLIAGIQAGFAMNGDSYPEFHQGLKGYGRY
jgi:hypothetical protein